MNREEYIFRRAEAWSTLRAIKDRIPSSIPLSDLASNRRSSLSDNAAAPSRDREEELVNDAVAIFELESGFGPFCPIGSQASNAAWIRERLEGSNSLTCAFLTVLPVFLPLRECSAFEKAARALCRASIKCCPSGERGDDHSARRLSRPISSSACF